MCRLLRPVMRFCGNAGRSFLRSLAGWRCCRVISLMLRRFPTVALTMVLHFRLSGRLSPRIRSKTHLLQRWNRYDSLVVMMISLRRLRLFSCVPLVLAIHRVLQVNRLPTRGGSFPGLLLSLHPANVSHAPRQFCRGMVLRRTVLRRVVLVQPPNR